MKIIKIFLASSIDEFKMERLEFERFIHVLNNIVQNNDIRLDLVVCEDMPNNLASTSMQDRINAQIPGCDYFYLVIGREAGEKSVEEFEVALKSMKHSGQPKIYTYFYNLNLDHRDEVSSSVSSFIDHLNDDLSHYFSVFGNFDTVKLDFLIELCRDFSSDSLLSFEDGQVKFQNESVLSLANIPIYGKNEELTELKERSQLLNERFAGLCADYAVHSDSQEIYQNLTRVSEERTRVLDRLHELEKNVFSLYSTVKSGVAEATWYEREARKQVESGNYKGAVAILNDIQRKKELEQTIQFADISLEKIAAHVRENELLIETLKAMRQTEDTVKEIRNCYQESYELTMKYHLNNKIPYDYAWYLCHTCGDYEKIVDIARTMKEQVKDDDVKRLADIYGLMGEAFIWNAHQLANGKYYYKEAARLYEQLEDSYYKYRKVVFCLVRVLSIYYIDGDYSAQKDLVEKLIKLCATKSEYIRNYSRGLVYRKLAEFYMKKGECQSYDKAEWYILEALKIAQGDSEAYCYSHLGDLYQKQNRLNEAYEAYLTAYTLQKKKLENNTFNTKNIVTEAQHLSNVLSDMGKHEKAVKYLEESVNYSRRLAERNPLSYEYMLTLSLHELGFQYSCICEYHKAEKAYREAYNRRKATLNRDDVYEYEVIYSCRALAETLTDLNRFDEAEVLYREALAISYQYAKSDPANEKYIRSSKRQFARNCLIPEKKFDEAEKYLTGLIEYQREYLHRNNQDIDSDLAWCLDAYACLLIRMKRAEDAVVQQREAFTYFKVQKDLLDYSIGLHNMAWVLIEAERYAEAFPYLDEELQLREKVAEEGNEDIKYGRLASTYKLYGEYCTGTGNIEEGRVYHLKALAEYERLAEICPDAFASDLADVHLSYAKLLIKAEDFDPANTHCRKAIELYTDLEKKSSCVYDDDLTEAYDVYVSIQKSKKRR